YSTILLFHYSTILLFYYSTIHDSQLTKFRKALPPMFRGRSLGPDVSGDNTTLSTILLFYYSTILLLYYSTILLFYYSQLTTPLQPRIHLFFGQHAFHIKNNPLG